MELTYRLSPEAILREYGRTGIRPMADQHLIVDAVRCTPEIRALYEALRSSDFPPLGEADRRFAGWDQPNLLRQHRDCVAIGEADRYLTEDDVLAYLQRSKDREDVERVRFQSKVDAAAAEMELIEGVLEIKALVNALIEAGAIRQKAENESAASRREVI